MPTSTGSSGEMAKLKPLRLEVRGHAEVSALLNRPTNARAILALAHGAGAGMNHPFLENLSTQLANVGMATLRYQFPYMEAQRRMPDPPAVLTATVGAAVRAASEIAAGMPVIAGGKSMGGRMTSQAAAEGQLEGVAGLVFFGFPLHPPNRPGTKRADHLAKVKFADALPPGNQGRFRRLEIAAADHHKTWTALHASRHRGRGSFVPRPKKIRKDRRGHSSGTGGSDLIVGRQRQRALTIASRSSRRNSHTARLRKIIPA